MMQGDSIRRPGVKAALLVAAVTLTGIASLLVGSSWLTPAEVLAGLFGPQNEVNSIIVREIRLPRVLLGLMAGASLGLSGAALQGLLRNPLADPGVIGVSASAGLGAVFAIYFGLSSVFLLAIPLLAMAGALMATLVLFALASRDTSVLTLILAGIGINGLAAALTSLVMNFAPTPFSLLDMVMWMLGSLSNRSFTDIALAGPFMVLGWVLMSGVGQGLSALSLGEDTAQTLGTDLKRLRLQVILGTAISVGAAVAVCGTIGFIGLVVPHIMRSFFGHDPRRILLPSAIGGAIFLSLADMLTRIPLSGGELRLGVVTAFVGSPVFLWIVIRTRGVMR
jgi:iron complex transport system permease protein